jgi:hypothetical protein
MTLPDGVFSYRVFRFPFAPKVVVSGVTGEDVVRDFSLEQNFPNPFNPKTAIRYRLSAISHVMLRVYDLLGREVAFMADDVLPAGDFIAHFDGSDRPSGIYIYRLVVEPLSGEPNEIRTYARKMVLLK